MAKQISAGRAFMASLEADPEKREAVRAAMAGLNAALEADRARLQRVVEGIQDGLDDMERRHDVLSAVENTEGWQRLLGGDYSLVEPESEKVQERIPEPSPPESESPLAEAERILTGVLAQLVRFLAEQKGRRATLDEIAIGTGKNVSVANAYRHRSTVRQRYNRARIRLANFRARYRLRIISGKIELYLTSEYERATEQSGEM